MQLLDIELIVMDESLLLEKQLQPVHLYFTHPVVFIERMSGSHLLTDL